MIVGIDIGGSTTDAVILDNGGVHVVTIEANDPVAAAAGALGKLVESYNLPLDEIACVAATGAGSRALSDTLFGPPVVKVNEFTPLRIRAPPPPRPVHPPPPSPRPPPPLPPA